MKICYLDTSYLLSYILEGKTSFEKNYQSFHFISSKLTLSETASALKREGVFPKSWSEEEWNYCSIMNDDGDLQKHQLNILEQGFIRGANLHHLALAEDFFEGFKEKYFASLDKAQKKLAKALGYKLVN